MNSKRLLITNIFLYLFILLGIFFCLDMVGLDLSGNMVYSPIAFFDKLSYRRDFTVSEYSALFIAFIVLTICSLYLEIKYNKLKLCYPLIIALGVVVIENIFTIFSAPSVTEVDLISHADGAPLHLTYHLSDAMRWYFLLSLIVSLIVMYVFLCVLPRRFYSKRQLVIGMILAYAFLVPTLIYGYIAQWDDVIRFFTEPNSYYPVYSFFGEKNNYAMFLVFMIVCTLYIHHLRPKWYFYALTAFLYLNILLTYSKINLLMGAVIILGYLFFRFFITFKKHKKSNIITLSLFSSLAIIASAVIIVASLSDIAFLSPIKNIINSIFANTGKTIEHRQFIYDNVYDILNNSSWVFGKGYGLFNSLLGAYNLIDVNFDDNKTDIPHQAFYQMIGMGGIVLLIIFICIFIYFIYVLIKIYKKHPSISALCGVFFVMYIVHSFFNSNMMLMYSSTPFADPAVIGLIMFLPALSCHYRDRHPEQNEEILFIAQSKVEIDINLTDKINYCLNFITPIFALLFSFIINIDNIAISLSVSIIILLLYLFVPFIIYKIKNNGTINDYLINILFPHLALAVFIIVISVPLIKLDTSTNAFKHFYSALILIVYFAAILLIKPYKNQTKLLRYKLKKANINIAKFHSKLIKKEIDNPIQ